MADGSIGVVHDQRHLAACSSHGAAVAAATHTARGTGHDCRVERWRVDRLLTALARMGLLLEDDDVGGAGLGADEGRMRALER